MYKARMDSNLIFETQFGQEPCGGSFEFGKFLPYAKFLLPKASSVIADFRDLKIIKKNLHNIFH